MWKKAFQKRKNLPFPMSLFGGKTQDFVMDFASRPKYTENNKNAEEM